MNLIGIKKRKILWAVLFATLMVSALALFMIEASTVTAASLSDPVVISTEIPGEMGYCVYQLSDGSLVVNSANETCTFLTKLDSSYQLLWSKALVLNQSGILEWLLPLRDGGFLLAGIIENQYVLLKTDSDGNTQWTKSYSSGAPINYLLNIIQLRDGGFAMAGFGVPVIDGLGWIWFAKTDTEGNIEWCKNISGPTYDCPSSIFETPDGGYILSDTAYSFVPDQAFYRLIKMDSEGGLLGNSSYGGYGYYYQPECNFAINTSDGGYLLGGYLWRKPAWVVKVDAEGAMQWNRTYGEEWCSVVDALETSNGYLFVMYQGKNQTGLILTDRAGLTIWNTTLSGVTLPRGLESNFNTITASNDGYIMVASKNHTVWLAKLEYSQDNSVIVVLAIGSFMVTSVLMSVLLLKAKNKKISSHIVCAGL